MKPPQLLSNNIIMDYNYFNERNTQKKNITERKGFHRDLFDWWNNTGNCYL